MTTQYKFLIAAMTTASVMFASTLAYNFYTYSQNKELYEKCLALVEKMDPKYSVIHCSAPR